MKLKFEMRRSKVVLLLHLHYGLSLTLLTMFIPLCLSCEKLSVDLCDRRPSLPVSPSICGSLDFHFSFSAVHTEPHEQTDVQRAEESEGCALSGRSRQYSTALIF